MAFAPDRWWLKFITYFERVELLVVGVFFILEIFETSNEQELDYHKVIKIFRLLVKWFLDYDRSSLCLISADFSWLPIRFIIVQRFFIKHKKRHSMAASQCIIILILKSVMSLKCKLSLVIKYSCSSRFDFMLLRLLAYEKMRMAGSHFGAVAKKVNFQRQIFLCSHHLAYMRYYSFPYLSLHLLKYLTATNFK